MFGSDQRTRMTAHDVPSAECVKDDITFDGSGLVRLGSALALAWLNRTPTSQNIRIAS